MAKCKLSGSSRQCGHRVSHAKNRRKHVFKANIQSRRIFVPSENKYVRVNVSTRVLRTLDKLGLEATLKKYNLTLKDITA
ncbi:MAG: 50S ribosomal protein L28 [Candidatus Dadabacteria bacterium]|nr:MAG: 50S ribosomal protein L28 [Candidatus Dadabacteria bacterium]